MSARALGRLCGCLLLAWCIVGAAVSPPQAALATANGQATEAGLAVLRRGGNAFDAAIAVSATLGLVEPESSGIGGGGFFLLHVARGNRDIFIDARERAPMSARADMYLDERGQPIKDQTIDGAKAAAIPGIPAAWEHLARRYGRLTLKQSLAPAEELARRGWVFGAKNAAMLHFREASIRSNAAAAEIILRAGRLPRAGERLRNPDYARTLQLLAERGASGFYHGPYAQRLVTGVNAGGGSWQLRDLASYRVVERKPIRFNYRGYRIVTAPPPSSAGVALAEIFHMLRDDDLQHLPRVDQVHLVTEAMRRAYRDRAVYLGDPDFVAVPVGLLTHPAYAAGLRASIHPRKATPSEALPGLHVSSEHEDTSHFSILDSEGNYVAVTQTINLPFGSAFAVPGTGFFLNNEMDDFSVKPGVPNAFGLVGTAANAIASGKRPLSSMGPTFLRGHDRVAILGTPGGSRIISMVALGLLQLMQGSAAQETVSAPRYHHQYLPDLLSAEQGAFDARAVADLRARGFTVSAEEKPWGNMQLVLWDRKARRVEAGTDPRWKGTGAARTENIILR